jgi:ABC-type multidrug transport system fused ATPase/permease subunit
MDLRLILGFAWPWRGTLALCALLMLAETGVALAVPWLAGQFAGQLLTGLAQAGGLLLVALLGLFAAQALLRFASSWLLGRTAEYILADLRTRLYDHLQALPLAYFQQRRHGEILALLTNDVARLAGYISGTLLSVVPLGLTVAGAGVMMLRIDARLTGSRPGHDSTLLPGAQGAGAPPAPLVQPAAAGACRFGGHRRGKPQHAAGHQDLHPRATGVRTVSRQD